MIYGYIRISTEKQAVDNQEYEINKYCDNHNLVIHKYIKETISSMKEKRQIYDLINELKEGDLIITCELSRLARKIDEIFKILPIIYEKKAKLISIKENFHLQDDIQSKVIAFAFSLANEIERKLISERTKEALARIKKEGKKLGRPLGKMSLEKNLNDNIKLIKQCLESKVSFQAITRLLKCHYLTLKNFCVKYNLKKFKVNNEFK